MNPNNLNLYIVDDDPAVRRSFGVLFQARLDGFAVQSFESGEEFLKNAHVDASGIAILDLRFDDVSGQVDRMSGLEVFQALKGRKSPLVIIFLSGHGTIPQVVDAMQDGAVSWLQKPCSDEVMLSTVQAAKKTAMGIAARRRERQGAIEKWARLSDREKEVAPVIARGKSAKVTAHCLTNLDPQRPIDHRTVENHWAKIRAKLDVANSNELQQFLTSYFPQLLEDQSNS
jgi:FixJ family two-component response regulator